MDQNSAFWARLMELMSIESQAAVKCHKNYIAAKLIEDPNHLWNIIEDNHLTNPTLSQSDTDIRTHFIAFNSWRLILIAAEIQIPTEKRPVKVSNVVGHE